MARSTAGGNVSASEPSAPEPNLGGRPRIDVTENDLRQIETAGRLGLRDDAVAQLLGWSAKTYQRRKGETDSPVLAAYKRGAAQSAVVVGNTLLNLVRRGNVTACIWFEKTRLGYAERREVSGPGGGPIPTEDLTHLTPEERRAKIAELLERGRVRAAEGEPETSADPAA